MTDGSTTRQLRIIVEVTQLAAGSNIEVWLRGGWAMDLLLGEVTRPHRDVDWFCWAADADALTALLRGRGYADDPGPPPEQQRDLVKDGVELSFALLSRDATGEPVVAGGPWRGTAYPAGMLSGWVGRLGDVTCPVISPHVQIELKEMYPVWMPERPVRTKDRVDIARLRAAITG
ncbi:aminoglycoside adenylyltransferase [Micromonospora sp. NPDC049679]|uniref:nucleotidyltransferase domain-containing protein n=1 Tax=Micromonospora sp. NPDC049679 TaxID=3155920 RepID=UPI0033E6A542